jgi:hypothetical protein
MGGDARFSDGDEAPLHLVAVDAEGLAIIAALAQDAVLTIRDMVWSPKRRRLDLLMSRFRWEDAPAAARGGRPPERVRALLTIEDVRHVATQGIDLTERDTVISLLDIAWTPGEDGTGRLTLVLAGDGAVAADVECIGVGLRDVSRPYAAASGRVPKHPE